MILEIVEYQIRDVNGWWVGEHSKRSEMKLC